jgi:hypothetical protein
MKACLSVSAIIGAVLLVSTPAPAQWLKFKTPGIPRTSDGSPNLTAPAPRTADGRPDLSGMWTVTPNFYWLDVILDIKDEAAFTPKAQAIFRKRAAEHSMDGPLTRCLPFGPGLMFVGGIHRLMQSATMIADLIEGGSGYRQIFMDGRELPKDPNPTWSGYSVGRWEGDTLVVETNGFNDRGWLDQTGHPRSEQLHVTERFRRIDFGHIQFQITFDDAEMLTRPLTIALGLTYAADTDMLEMVCNENERDTAHAVASELKPKIQLAAAALRKYAGAYGPPQGPPFLSVTLLNDQLYVWDIPLFPESETVFVSKIADFKFSFDASGAVTGADVDLASGQHVTWVRKP